MKIIMGKYIVTLLLNMCLLGSSSTAQTLIGDEAIDTLIALSVKGRQGWLLNQKLSFGSYTTGKVKRSWTSGSSYGFGTTVANGTISFSEQMRKRKQTYSFPIVNENKDTLFASCAVDIRTDELSLGNVEGRFAQAADGFFELSLLKSDNLYIQIKGKGDEMPWQLLLDRRAADRQSQGYTGYLYGPDQQQYKITPVKNLRAKNGKKIAFFGLAGYRISDKADNPVAIVSLIDKGIVYLSKSSSHQESLLMAAVSASILLQQELDQ